MACWLCPGKQNEYCRRSGGAFGRRHRRPLGNGGSRLFWSDPKAAQLESSKAYAKAFMERWDIPTAINIYRLDEAKAFIDQIDWTPVLKASGLAAGKTSFYLNPLKRLMQSLPR